MVENTSDPLDGLLNTATVVGNSSSTQMTLEALNAMEAKKYLGGAIFVGLLMVVGLIGNVHVLLVYTFRIKPSNHRTFILTLAILDTVTCAIGMPFILVDLSYPLMFFMTAACKILRFINYFICAASALVLVVIAVDRYRKICVPLSAQMSQRAAKIYCGVAIAIAMAMSWPAPILYGHGTIETGVDNITGVRCWTDDRFKDTKYQGFFNAVLIFIVLAVFIILVVLYSLIGKQIWRHRRFRPETNKGPESVTTTATKDSSEVVETPLGSKDSSGHDGNLEKKPNFNPEAFQTLDGKASSNHNQIWLKNKKRGKYSLNDANSIEKTKKVKKKQDRTKRTTFMLFMITVVFFCSFFPHLILKIVTFTKKDFVPGMSFKELVFFNTVIWSFFINNMANPLIYGYCDMHFRQELAKGYRGLLCR